MHEIIITDKMRESAEEAAKKLGRLKNSISKGKGNHVGFLGELMVASYLNGNCKIANTYDYDLVLPDGTTIDVKSKTAKVKPLDYYECSIAAYNTKQNCEYYVFCRVLSDKSKGWILGFDSKKDFMDTAKFLKKGDIDGDNDYIVPADCYNKPIKDLMPPKKLLDMADAAEYVGPSSTYRSIS